MMTATPTRQISAPSDVPAVGPEPVERHPPQQRPGHEHPAVGGEDAPEVRIRLQGRDEPVEPERDHPGADPDPAAVLAHALPDQPRAADLGQRGEDEQNDRAGNGHGASVDRSPDPARALGGALAPGPAAQPRECPRRARPGAGTRPRRPPRAPPRARAATPAPRRPHPHRRAAPPRSGPARRSTRRRPAPASPAGSTRHHRARAGHPGRSRPLPRQPRRARRTAADSTPFSAQVIRSSQPASRAARNVSRMTARSASLASTSASFAAARACNPSATRRPW